MEILLTVAWVVGGLIVAFVLLALVAVIAIGGMASREEERRQEQRQEMNLMAFRECRLQRNKRQWN
jgi:beta-lactamase regulating signal transducer with metallopeptidase domain